MILFMRDVADAAGRKARAFDAPGGSPPHLANVKVAVQCGAQKKSGLYLGGADNLRRLSFRSNGYSPTSSNPSKSLDRMPSRDSKVRVGSPQ